MFELNKIGDKEAIFMSKSDFLIPVGTSPVPVYRAANALHKEYNVSLICTNTTKKVGLKVKNYLGKNGIPINLLTCFDEEGNDENLDLFEKNKEKLSKLGAGEKNIYVGPGSKLLISSMVISFPQSLIRIWVEKKDIIRKGSMPVLKRISGVEKDLKLSSISEDEVLNLLDLKRIDENSLIYNGKLLIAKKLKINTLTGKIELLYNPLNFKNMGKEKIKREFRSFETEISKNRSEWEKSVGMHVLVFKIGDIIYDKKFKNLLEIQRKRLDPKWKGGEIICH